MTNGTCEHLNFQSIVQVTRLTEVLDGPVTGYTIDMKVYCDACKKPFRFIGLTAGSHPSEPRVSVDGTELRAPIEPIDRDKLLHNANYTMPTQTDH